MAGAASQDGRGQRPAAHRAHVLQPPAAAGVHEQGDAAGAAADGAGACRGLWPDVKRCLCKRPLEQPSCLLTAVSRQLANWVAPTPQQPPRRARAAPPCVSPPHTLPLHWNCTAFACAAHPVCSRALEAQPLCPRPRGKCACERPGPHARIQHPPPGPHTLLPLPLRCMWRQAGAGGRGSSLRAPRAWLALQPSAAASSLQAG